MSLICNQFIKYICAEGILAGKRCEPLIQYIQNIQPPSSRWQKSVAQILENPGPGDHASELFPNLLFFPPVSFQLSDSFSYFISLQPFCGYFFYYLILPVCFHLNMQLSYPTVKWPPLWTLTTIQVKALMQGL